jgi:hypothetical protein
MNENGTPRTSIQCKSCKNGEVNDPKSIWQCKAPCKQPDHQTYNSEKNECFCTDKAKYILYEGMCVERSEKPDDDKNNLVFYHTLGKGKSVESALFKDLYIEALVGCKTGKNPRQCQVLANLCTLQLYDMQRPACKEFDRIVNGKVKGKKRRESRRAKTYDTKEWKRNMPWLFYGNKKPKDILKKQIKAKVRVAFNVRGRRSTT